ncbi:sodium-dependent transporter [Symbiobacterium thermophilum]|uniref:Transporter n=2 Tax=Symbiobacterium thermophilum TaxID=2734 RepID=Q67SB6_SYMTH|nr:sodium-dependent transporter [Symbiobacterium thermophilum]BAA24689.2 tnaT [Symbiobacterium thermophilum]BAD39427.1 sodium- and chloride-dependent transporter, TnaT [Symbiobacterium thermophilum IAM 14863]
MEAQRDQWKSRSGFIFATIGAAVGLGNFWRFPFMAYQNGGGAFLLPYFVALLTAGVPLMILEFGFGHKMRTATITAFKKLNRRFEWIGWWQITVPVVVVTFYSVIISWSLRYLIFSFTQAWGDDPGTFFSSDFLGITSGPLELGGLRWGIFAAVAVVWFANYYISAQGISGGIEKACKIMTPFLIVAMLIFVIRGITLPGATYGLNYFLNPDFSKIMDPGVWVAAYSQVFFSTTLAVGVMIAYASYVPEDSDLANNAFITVFANSSFDFMAGLAVFSTLGYAAVTAGVPFEEMAVAGPGVAFVAFPKAISMLPGPTWLQSLFGILFFSALLLAGISSSISQMESFASAVIDRFGVDRKKLLGWFSLIGFAFSALFATGAGVHILDIVDHFVGSYAIAILGLVEAIVLGYIMGTARIREHVNLTSDIRVGMWWDVLVKYVTPVLLGYNILSNFISEFREPYAGYPTGALVLFGWVVAIAMFGTSLFMQWRSQQLDVTGGEVG